MPAETYGVIWDMDGTLVDTAELHFAAWEEVCRGLGRPFSRADFAATFGRRNPEIIAALFGDRFGDRQAADLGDRKEVLYREAARRGGVAPLPGVVPLLEGLRRAGVRQAIGSSAPRANLDLILEVMGVSGSLDVLVSAGDSDRGQAAPQAAG